MKILEDINNNPQDRRDSADVSNIELATGRWLKQLSQHAEVWLGTLCTSGMSSVSSM